MSPDAAALRDGRRRFDEVHFGKFASYYIRGQYFFDIHPPLAKLLIAAAAYFVGGFDGSFDFGDIGLDYRAHHVPYVTMRAVGALQGALAVPVGYALLAGLGCSPAAAAMGAAALLFGTSPRRAAPRGVIRGRRIPDH